MAEREENIQHLRTQLQASRWQLHDTLQHLEDRFNVSRRIKSELAAHPWKWTALALGVGVIAATTMPWLARAGRRAGVGRLFAPALRLAMVAALPALTRGIFPKTSTLE